MTIEVSPNNKLIADIGTFDHMINNPYMVENLHRYFSIDIVIIRDNSSHGIYYTCL